MLIVQAFWYHDTVTGDFFYRIKQPKVAMERVSDANVCLVHTSHPVFPDLALAADVLILHMCAEEELGPLIRLRRKLGRITVFEIADHFLAPHAGISRDDPWRSPIIRERLLNHAHAADALQVSTHGLAQRYGGLNKNVGIFENVIEQVSEPSVPNVQRVVLGWGGSMGHDHDLAGWKPQLLALLERHAMLQLAFMCPEELFYKHFGQFPAHRVSFTKPGPLETYYTFLKGLDIGLAPAEDTSFNRCRSDGKFLEYAAHGVVPVLADIETFRHHGQTGKEKLLYGSIEEGVAHVESLLKAPDRRHTIAKAAVSYVMAHRLGDRAGTERLRFYRELGGSGNTNAAQAPAADGLMASLRLALAEFDLGAYLQAERRLQDLLGVFPGYAQAHFALLACWQAQGKYAAIVDKLRNGGVPHTVYRDLSFAILVDALRQLGRGGEHAILDILADPVVRADTCRKQEPGAWEVLAKYEPFRCDVMRFLLISKSREGAMAKVSSLAQVLGIIEDSIQDVAQDEALGGLLMAQT